MSGTASGSVTQAHMLLRAQRAACSGSLLPSPPMTAVASLFADAPVISCYSRAQALADGVLLDAARGALAPVTAQHFVGLTPLPSVVIAPHLGAAMRAAVAAGADLSGVWHDVLFLATAASGAAGNLGRAFYESVTTLGPRRWSFVVRIGAATELVLCDIGPGDAGEPVVTLMLRADR